MSDLKIEISREEVKLGDDMTMPLGRNFRFDFSCADLSAFTREERKEIAKALRAYAHILEPDKEVVQNG